MPQVRKPEVAHRIREAALELFAEHGYQQTQMASVARVAGVATANIYRYYPDGKQQLFERVITDEIADAHEELVTERVRAMFLPLDRPPVDTAAAQRLLEFWIAYRREVVVLLDRADGTRFAGYGERFVQLLVELAVDRLQSAGAPPNPATCQLLELIFASTRRALAAILLTHDTEDAIRRAIEGFWSYQLAGLDGLYRWATRHP